MVLVLQLLEDRLVQRAHFAYGQAGVLLQAGGYQCYILPQAPCGMPWSGVLPEMFVKANRWNKELYFEVR